MKHFFATLLLLLLTAHSDAQMPEHYFRFLLTHETDLNILTKLISIDNVEDGYVYAYASEEQWKEFKKLGVPAEELPHPSSLYDHKMSNAGPQEWDSYPTYSSYKNMMQSFASSHPDICMLDTIGYSVQNRLLLVLKISDNVNANEDEPEFFYTSSIHGDETVGFILMLRLADHLLAQYGQTTAEGIRATKLVNSLEIWINPLANPDGTYRLGGDTTVNFATRNNANNKDLNRNFPDRISDTNNILTGRERETQAMMMFASNRNLTMSANFHGGAAVVNYPWDNGAPSGQYSACPDDAWFIVASKAYSTTNPDLMNGGFANGITNGCQWYSVFGGRQDWIYTWYGVRETTIELWNIKNPPGTALPQRWNNNKESLLAYMEQSLSGIHGIVIDSATAQPVSAKIHVQNYTTAFVKTDPAVGDYHRPLLPGTYNVIFIAPGYITDTVRNVAVTDSTSSRLDHQMRRVQTNISTVSLNSPGGFLLWQNFPNPFNPETVIRFEIPVKEHVSIRIFDNAGKESAMLVNSLLSPGAYETKWNVGNNPSGVYYCKLFTQSHTRTIKMILIR